jgi:two-component system, NarL family, nitrate/nitrite response regulator NarL
MATAYKIRILVASLREICRESLAMLLSAQPRFDVVGCIGYDDNFADEIRRTTPDVLLLERDSSDSSWLLRLRAIVRSEIQAKAILISDAVGQEPVAELIEVGVRGIVARDATVGMLFKSIHCVNAGEYWIGRERVGDVMNYLRKGRNGTHTGDQLGLTTRELDVLRALLTGMSNKEIAQVLAISSQAVRHHLCSIFNKVGVSNRLELALFAIHHSLLTSLPSHSNGSQLRASHLIDYQ